MRVGKYSVKNEGELHDLLGHGYITEATYEKYRKKFEQEDGLDFKTLYYETLEELNDLKHRFRCLGYEIKDREQNNGKD